MLSTGLRCLWFPLNSFFCRKIKKLILKSYNFCRSGGLGREASPRGVRIPPLRPLTKPAAGKPVGGFSRTIESDWARVSSAGSSVRFQGNGVNRTAFGDDQKDRADLFCMGRGLTAMELIIAQCSNRSRWRPTNLPDCIEFFIGKIPVAIDPDLVS